MSGYDARRALFSNLIDYAGTFPPAALDLEKMLQMACRYRREASHPWLLAKVVVTIEDLKKLSSRLWFDAGSDGTPVPLTVIGSAVPSAADLTRVVGFEVREARRFNEKFKDASQRQQVFSYETRLPENASVSSLQPVLCSALDAALDGEGLDLDIYFEISLAGEWETRLDESARALAGWSEGRRARWGRPGIKVRTGGKFLPTPEQLTEVVVACSTYGLRFKATQGLHHALSRDGEYGFINLFSALAFAGALGTETFDPSAIHDCLLERDSKAFAWNAAEFRWKHYSVAVEQIEAARRRHGGCFGSCSLEEPDQFLSEEMS